MSAILNNIFRLSFPLLFSLYMSLWGCNQSRADDPKTSAILKTNQEVSAPIVVLETTQGNIHLKLFPEVAPKAVENFLGLVRKGYYDGIIFHRVIKDFMIQGGDPTGTGAGGESIWGGPFEDEVTALVSFDRQGLLAMANAGPNTNGSQFFITTVKTPWLNMKHTIFGEVIEGFSIVKSIENIPTGPGGRSVEDQIILKAYVKE